MESRLLRNLRNVLGCDAQASTRAYISDTRGCALVLPRAYGWRCLSLVDGRIRRPLLLCGLCHRATDDLSPLCVATAHRAHAGHDREFLRHIQYLRYPLIHIPATYLVMGSACSIALGHLGYGLMREHFVMGQLLLQKNETLIARVEQTSSVVGTLIQHLDATRKAERTKIARTLHDELGQLIVGARMKISNIERRFHKHGPDQTSTALTSDLESLAELMEELNVSSRDLLTELRTKEERNLEQRINALVEPLSDQKDLVVRVEFQASNESFPEDVEECIYRTIQEALTNVVKHAGSCDVSISVNLAETDAVVVTVQDTGAGFEQAVIPAGSSWGLVGMRERVEEANGTLSIVSGASGTQISVRLPLPKGGSY